MTAFPIRCAAFAALAASLLTSPASAGLMLSKVILDLGPDAAPRDDIELWNDGDERLYVVAEPSEIVDPGLPTEQRRTSPNPAVTGLLVTPQKLILEPGEHKLVRVAAVAARPARDRVYRVTIKPVAGPISADQSALKLFVGYDALVLYRPDQPKAELSARRNGRQLTIHNGGNTNVELTDGRQCVADGQACRNLPTNRLYPGADWSIDIPYTTAVHYRTLTAGRSGDETF